jgi:predicted TIM-barrel fold metal-dependent hydrolase
MIRIRPSRRDILKSIGATMLASAFGLEPWSGPGSVAADEPAAKPVIDTHVHLVNVRLPAVPELTSPDKKAALAPFTEANRAASAAGLAKVIQAEMKAAGVEQALCMPRYEVSDKDPLGIKEIEALAPLVREVRLHPIGLAHPERFDRDHLARVEEVLKQHKVKALKVYLGYLHYGPSSPGYRPYYKLAAEHDVPVIFHTGDTFSDKAKVKYAHPLQIDEVAVDFPRTKFVLAHFGNPWIADAAEVVYKNKNVWADLPGLLIGDEKYFAALKEDGALARMIKRLQQGIEYVETAEKFLFGSDWPLAPLRVYRDFVRGLFPEKHHQAVFHDNAQKLFKLEPAGR